ncbi:Uncharacterised protein [Lederbergia lenta]|uniref:Uncharacterized protein n=1 Tax=Lederbergia lenta TaxID=1467 RepID=A0A2X4X128_LEDLE|nr:Uncharacterised protein [Lederbergia lenta]
MQDWKILLILVIQFMKRIKDRLLDESEQGICFFENYDYSYNSRLLNESRQSICQ